MRVARALHPLFHAQRILMAIQHVFPPKGILELLSGMQKPGCSWSRMAPKCSEMSQVSLLPSAVNIPFSTEVVDCPAHASGWPDCACVDGFSGTVTWNQTLLNYVGTCKCEFIIIGDEGYLKVGSGVVRCKFCRGTSLCMLARIFGS